MRRILLLCILFEWPLFSQAPVITQGPYLGAATISRSSASIAWATNIPADTQIYWSSVSAANVTPTNCVSPNCNVSMPAPGANTPILAHNWYTFGTPGASTIYYQVCSKANSLQACSATNSYTSAAQSVVPADPIPPVPVDPPTIPAGTIWRVGANCDDPTTGLVAMWKSAARGDIVEIDPTITPYCAGTYTFPAKTSGPPYILTRVKNAANTFVNNRRTNLGDLPTQAGFGAGTNLMIRFIHSAPNVYQNGSGDPATLSCFGGDLDWRSGQSNGWAMYRCNNVNPQAITAIPTNGSLRIIVPSHGLPEGYMTWVTGVTGPGAVTVNGGWKVHIIDANTVELHPFIDSGPVQATGAASGGSISLNRYQLEPVTEGTTAPPTGSCTFGQWYHQQAGSGTADEYHRTWYCDAPNEWIAFRFDTTGGNGIVTPPVIDIATNKLDHLMFQGLSFEPMHLKADPQRLEYKYLPVNSNSGFLYYSFIGQTIYNDHIYWDNILAGCPDPSLTGEMERCWGMGFPFDGKQIHVGGSYLYGFQIFHTLEDLDDSSSVGLYMTQGGPYEFTNNYFGCSGICIFASGDLTNTTDLHDVTLTRNTIETPDKYWDPAGALLTQGFYFSQRHRSERKRVHREIDDGNIFIGGWVWINQAAGYCLCTRTAQAEVQTQSLKDDGTTTVVQGYEPSAAGYGWMYSDFTVGDYITFMNAPYGATGACTAIVGKIYQVTAVTDYTHFSVNTTGCTAGGGALINRLNPRTGNISDVLIENQTWLRNPTDLAWLGHDSYPWSIGPVLQRVKLRNNLSVGLDGLRVGHGGYYAAPSVAPSGSHLNLVEGGEDLQDVHETVVGRTEAYYESGDYGNGGASAGSGLLMANNIFEYLTYGSVFGDGMVYGTAFLNHEWADLGGTSPSYTFTHNVILRKGGCGGVGPGYPYGYPQDPCAGAPWGPFPPGQFWYDTNSGPFPFFNSARGNYRLKNTSTFCSGCRDHGTDGLDIGVNVDALEAARGDVSNVRVFGLNGTTATVGFLAPDTLGCPVDWSTNNFSTYTRVQNPGGARTQNVALEGLPAKSTISYRINCVVMQPSGKFTTP